MKSKITFLSILSVITALSGTSAFALNVVTHSGKIDMDLQLVDASGTLSKIDSETASFQVDWNASACTAVVNKLSLNCIYNRTKDLNAPNGSLLVHGMPTAHFDNASVDSVIRLLGAGDKRTKDIIGGIVADTSSTRSAGFDLPTYTCEKCIPDATGKIVPWNAFESFVLRTLEINHPSLGGKKLVLRMKLYKMSADDSKFHIIGNNDAGNFGTH